MTDMVSVPRELLREVLERAEVDSFAAESDHAAFPSEHALYEAERVKIEALRRYTE